MHLVVTKVNRYMCMISTNVGLGRYVVWWVRINVDKFRLFAN
jgi:hypothetical protein